MKTFMTKEKLKDLTFDNYGVPYWKGRSLHQTHNIDKNPIIWEAMKLCKELYPEQYDLGIQGKLKKITL